MLKDLKRKISLFWRYKVCKPFSWNRKLTKDIHNLIYGNKVRAFLSSLGFNVIKTKSKEESYAMRWDIFYSIDHAVIPESVYYNPVKDKFYFSKDYSPLGKIANKTFYEYIGEL